MENVAHPLPMFPLSCVTFPGGELALQVFEPRYRVLARDLYRGGGRFGTVLISRGSEVGGGETRVRVGSLMRSVEIAPLRTGEFFLHAVAEERLDVVSWLPDDPYPIALVQRSELAPTSEPPDIDALLGSISNYRERITARGGDGQISNLVDFPMQAEERQIWRLLDALPIGVFERQGLLESLDLRELVKRGCVAIDHLVALMDSYDFDA